LAIGAAVPAAAAVHAISTAGSAAATTTVLASSFGHDPLDATESLQAALDSTADVVVIDHDGADWVTRPLFVRRNNLTVVIEAGVTVRAKAGGFTGSNDSLLTIDNRENVAILGRGATFVMNKSEYTTGEWRMGLSLRSARNVTVEGLAIRDAGGDGIYLGVSATVPSAPRHNVNITLRDVQCDNSLRNGLSVISVDGLLVEGCSFTNSSGKNPEAGIDFEPNLPNERLSSIVVRDTTLTGNNICQLMFYLMKLDATSTPVSVIIERVRVDQQPGNRPVFMYTGPGDSDPGGSIEIRDSLFTTRVGSGNLGLYHRSSSGIDLTFRRCVLWNWGNTFVTHRPVMINAGRSDGSLPITNYGGIVIDDCLLATDQVSPIVKATGPTTSHLTDVTGLLTVVGPSTVTADYGTAPTGVTLALPAVAASPSFGALGATVSVSPLSASITPGSPITFTFFRAGGLTSRPLAVRYNLGGTASARVDRAGLSGAVVFPAGATSVTVTVTTPASATAGTTIVPTVVSEVFYA